MFSAFGQIDYVHGAKICVFLLWEWTLWENNTPIRNIFSSFQLLEKFQCIFWLFLDPTKNEIPHEWKSPTKVIPTRMKTPHNYISLRNEILPRM